MAAAAGREHRPRAGQVDREMTGELVERRGGDIVARLPVGLVRRPTRRVQRHRQLRVSIAGAPVALGRQRRPQADTDLRPARSRRRPDRRRRSRASRNATGRSTAGRYRGLRAHRRVPPPRPVPGRRPRRSRPHRGRGATAPPAPGPLGRSRRSDPGARHRIRAARRTLRGRPDRFSVTPPPSQRARIAAGAQQRQRAGSRLGPSRPKPSSIAPSRPNGASAARAATGSGSAASSLSSAPSRGPLAVCRASIETASLTSAYVPASTVRPSRVA